MTTSRGAYGALLALFLAACSAPGAEEQTATDAPNRQPFTTVAPSSTMPEGTDDMSGNVPADILQAISQDAATVTATDVADLEIVMAKAVTWNDGSLGCPEPGMMYTQALVDGYQVVVRAADQELDYRIGRDGAFMICEDGTDSPGSSDS
ncbi:MAG: hypothetical protein M3406_07845 [Chloroflexota bacterium]|nr:hypothetical protein [Chloroflexota bacterium]